MTPDGGKTGPFLTSRSEKPKPIFQPEFGSFMVEATPGVPYDNSLTSMLSVQGNMARRRRMIQERLGENEAVVTIPGFPRLGAPGTFTQPPLPSGGLLLRSQFLPDGLVSTYERYGAIHDNIYTRREGRAFKIKAPIFKDEKTPWPWRESNHFGQANGAQEHDAGIYGHNAENFIYGDSMSFGPTLCGLQVTLQARNLREARYLHDQLCPVGPILMALTAGTPFFRGFLTDTDVRWNHAAAAVDDRTSNELSSKVLRSTEEASIQPRWAPTAMYLADDARLRSEYNNSSTNPDPNRTIAEKLQNKGMDTLLASHYAAILARDPIAMTEKDLEAYAHGDGDGDADTDIDVFEILHSAVWPHVDFKLPSKKEGRAGWRVELRPLEVQLTDFDNAAFVVFVALLARTILHFDLNFYIPIEKVAENMTRAHTRDAVREEQFFFRRDVWSSSSAATAANAKDKGTYPPIETEYTLMTVNEIMNGSKSVCSNGSQCGNCSSSSSSSCSFEGLIPLVERYVREVYAGESEDTHDHKQDHQQGHELGHQHKHGHQHGQQQEQGQEQEQEPPHRDDQEHGANQLLKYLAMIRNRASGKIPTPATWMRRFVQIHKDYRQDSVVSESTCYDLMCCIRDLGDGDARNV
ncbi:hypothetical protein G647_04080 [Cladophialophora carrionii CBS 160.54]|uniref:Glutamate--cysteine ligase n=1 Tax=Cladophialophora carrionii CBS 160.54 TaxID=1279043 RepID=V9DDD7_9EURO|nr:uncharacterized protein G647_04080 [Cladophialophora carrionii CBS 160.54]ETI24711.1 hypothetical protein G647_04080 [Cladophialophora carrionii CBS 160.54]